MLHLDLKNVIQSLLKIMMHIMHTVVTELPKNSCYCNIANKNQFLITM